MFVPCQVVIIKSGMEAFSAVVVDMCVTRPRFSTREKTN